MCETGARPKILTIYCRVRPERIVLLRHILEGYDNLAFPSTLDAADGLARILTPSSNYFELMALLESLAPALTPYPVQPVQQP